MICQTFLYHFTSNFLQKGISGIYSGYVMLNCEIKIPQFLKRMCVENFFTLLEFPL